MNYPLILIGLLLLLPPVVAYKKDYQGFKSFCDTVLTPLFIAITLVCGVYLIFFGLLK